MRVLIACEESATVRVAFEKEGHEAWSCDVQPSRVAGNHIQADVLSVLGDGWDLMIAHPPCTYLSKAGARWLYGGGEINQERYELGMKAKEFFMQLLNSNIPMIAVENPTPLKIWELPKETQAIQPYEFGHPYSKRTLLWLKNLPPLVPTNKLDEYKPFLPSNTGGKKRGQAHSFGVARNAKESSKTFEGVAQAMAQQWGRLAFQQGLHLTDGMRPTYEHFSTTEANPALMALSQPTIGR